MRVLSSKNLSTLTVTQLTYNSYCCCSVATLCLTLWPHGLQDVRLPCPSLSPRVCSHSYPLSWRCHIENIILVLERFKRTWILFWWIINIFRHRYWDSWSWGAVPWGASHRWRVWNSILKEHTVRWDRKSVYHAKWIWLTRSESRS